MSLMWSWNDISIYYQSISCSHSIKYNSSKNSHYSSDKIMMKIVDSSMSRAKQTNKNRFPLIRLYVGSTEPREHPWCNKMRTALVG